MATAGKYVVEIVADDSGFLRVVTNDSEALAAVTQAASAASAALNENAAAFSKAGRNAEGLTAGAQASVAALEQQLSVAKAFASGQIDAAEASRALALAMAGGDEATAKLILEQERLENELSEVVGAMNEVQAATEKRAASIQNQTAAAQQSIAALEQEISLNRQVANSTITVEEKSAALARARGQGDAVLEELLVHEDRLKRELQSQESALEDSATAWSRVSGFIADHAGKLTVAAVAVGGLAAAYKGLGALVTGVSEAVGRGAEIDALSNRTGVAAEELGSFSVIADAAGTTVDVVARSMTNLARNMNQASTGVGGAADAFRTLGVDIRDQEGNFKQPLALFKELADRFAEMPPSAEEVSLAMRAVGEEAGPALLAAMNQGSAGIDRYIGLAEDLGLAFGGDVAASMASASLNLSLLGRTQEAVFNQIATGLAPGLNDLTNALIELVTEAGVADGGLRAFGATLGDVLTDAARQIDELRERIAGMDLASAFHAAAADLGVIVATEGLRLGGVFTDAFLEAMFRDTSQAEMDAQFSSVMRQSAKEGVAAFVDEFGSLDQLSAGMRARFADQIAEFENAQAISKGVAAGIAAIAKELGAEEAAATKAAHSMDAHVAAYRDNQAAAGELTTKIGETTASLTASNAAVRAEIEAYNDARVAGLSLAEAELAVARAMVEHKANADLAAGVAQGVVNDWKAQALAAVDLASELGAVKSEYGDLGKGADQATKALQAQRDTLEGQVAIAETFNETLDTATAAGLSFAEATEAAEVASARHTLQLGLEGHSATDLGRSILDAHDELVRLNAERQRSETLTSLAEENELLQFQTALYEQVAARLITREQAERAIAVHLKEQDLLAGNVTENVHELALQSVAIAEGFDAATEAVERMGESTINLGDSFREGVLASLDAVISDTRKFSEVWEGIGVSVLKDFASGFLSSKKGLLDLPVETNFLSLGETLYNSLVGNGTAALSDLGSLFSGGGAATDGSSSSGLNLGSLLTGGGELTTTTFSDPHLKPGEKIIGSAELPDGTPAVLVEDQFGDQKKVPKDVSTEFNFGNAVSNFGAGAVGGFGGAQLGNQFINNTNLPSFFGSFEKDILDRAHVINEILSTIVGGAVGLAGGGALGGGVVGILSSIFGDMLLDDLSLKDFENGQFSNSLLPALGTIFAGPFAFSGAGNDFFNSLGFDLLGLPRTRGGAIRSGLEPFLNDSEALQRFRPFFNDNDFSGEQIGDLLAPGAGGSINGLLERRGVSRGTFDEIRGLGEAVFADIGRELDGRFLGDTAFSAGLMFAETFTQGAERGLSDQEILAGSVQAVRAFAAEHGVTFQSVLERMGAVQDAFRELGRVDGSPGNALQEGFDAVGRSVAGAITLFEQDFPAGTQTGLVALQSMVKDGEAAFGDLSQSQKEALLTWMEDFESTAELFSELSARGFEFDPSVLEDRLASAAASASFLGENFSSSLQAAGGNVDLFVQDVRSKLGALASDTIVGESFNQLFDTTAIGQAFQPVFDVLGRIGEFDLTPGGDIAGFKDVLIPALLEGKENLEEYKPAIREILQLLKEVDEEIAEAFAPTKAEQAIAVVESAFGSLGSAASSAVETGLAVMEETGSYERGLAAFTSVFVTGAEENLKQAVLSALIDATVLQPIIDRFQPAFSFIVASGMEHGFDDPRVQAAWQQQLALLRADVEGAAPLIFDANIEFATSSGGDFGAVLVQQVEQAQAEIRDVFGNAVGAGLAEIERVIADGGRTRAAIAKGSKVFAEAFGDSIQESTTAAITSAITQGVILEGRLAPLLAELRLKTAAALDDGVITAAERADLSALGGKIVAEGHRAAGELTPVFQDIGLISLDVQNLDEVSKQAQRVAQKHGLLPADVEQFLRAAEGVDPEALKEFFELLADAERPFRDAAQKFRAVDDSIDERTLINFFKAAEGVDPDKLTSYFSALVEHEESLRNASIWYAEITGVDQETLLGFFRAAEGVDPDALKAYFEALEARDAAEADAADSATKGLESLAVQTDSVVTSLGNFSTGLEQLAVQMSSIQFGVAGFATGGSLREGSAVVGEAGMPELVTALPGGGFRVTPLNRAQAAALMGDGVAGLAIGGDILPGGGGNTLINQQEIDRLRAENLRLKREAKSGSGGSGGGDGIAQLVSPNLSSTIGDFLLGGVESVSDDVTASVGGSILDGVTQGFLEAEKTKAILEPLNQAVVDAMSDGVLTAAEAESIKTLGESASAELTAAIEDMGPAFSVIAKAFGLGIEEELVEVVDPIQKAFEEMIAGIAPSLEGGIGGSIERALLDGTLRGADNMEGFLKQTVGSSVLGALTGAFVTSGVLGAQIQRFAQIAGAQVELLMTDVLTQAQFDTVMEGMTRDFISNVGPIIDTIQQSLGPLQDFFGVDFAGTVNDNVRPIVDDATAVVGASEDVCAAKCDLVKRTTELSDIGLNLAGARGNISIESLVPRAQLEEEARLADLTARGLMAQEAFDAYLAENGLTGNRIGHKGAFLRVNPEFVGVPFFAEGGIAFKPTLGVFAEAGEPEIVAPLSKLPEVVQSVLPRVAEAAPVSTAADDARFERLERKLEQSNDEIRELRSEMRGLIRELRSSNKRPVQLIANEQVMAEVRRDGEGQDRRARISP